MRTMYLSILLSAVLAGSGYATPNPQDYYNRGYVYAQKGYTQNAIEEFSQALEMNPPQQMKSRIHYTLGQLYLKTEQYDRAVSQYEEAAKLQPQAFIIQFALANAYWKNQQYDNAITYFERAIQIDPNYHNIYSIYYTLGICYSKTGQYEKGIPYLDKVLEKDPDNIGVMEELAQAYLTIGQYKQVEQLLNRLEGLGQAQSEMFRKLQQARSKE